jgi:hypothetical protein
MARKNFGDGALRLIGPTTAVGVSDSASITPVQTVTAQVVAGSSGVTGTVAVEGSLEGNLYFTAIAASTFRTSTAGGSATMITSTSTHIYTHLRANLSVTGTTEDITIFVAGR